MFAQSVSEDASTPIFKILGTPIQLSFLIFIGLGFLTIGLATYFIFVYLLRRKYLSKAERKPKVLKLP